MTPAADLVADAVHVDVDDVRVRVEVHLPHVGEQVLARARAAGARHEVAQDPELALGQLDRRRAVAEVDAAAHEIEREPPGAEMALGLGRRRRAAPQMRADARDELGELERLGDEVGGAELEAADLHVDVGRGREHEDALLGPRCA